MMYLMPLMFIFSGVTFVIGLLLYMLTTNIWTMGQQFYTIRRMPAPGSLAEKALEARRLKSGKEHKKFTIPGLTHDDEAEEVQDTPAIETKPKSGQRQQPKRKKRVKPAGQAVEKPIPGKQPGPTQQASPAEQKPGQKQKPDTKPRPAADGDA